MVKCNSLMLPQRHLFPTWPPEKITSQRFFCMEVQPQAPCFFGETLANQVRVRARARHSAAEGGVITLAAPEVAHSVHHMLGPLREVPLQPVLEQLVQFMG